MKNLLLAIVFTLTLAGSLCAGTDPIAAVNATQAVFVDINSFLSPLWLPEISVATTGLPWLQAMARRCRNASQDSNCNNDQLQLRASDGSPMPVCQPGKNCNNDQWQLRASDGSPIPHCHPGKKCNNDQFQLRASDGSPIPQCDPGKKCTNDQCQLRASDGSPIPQCEPGKKLQQRSAPVARERWLADAGVPSGPAIATTISGSCAQATARRYRNAIRERNCTKSISGSCEQATARRYRNAIRERNAPSDTVAAASKRRLADTAMRSGKKCTNDDSGSCEQATARRYRNAIRERNAPTISGSCEQATTRRCRPAIRGRTAATITG